MDVPTGRRVYGDLAMWWPLISPPEEYAEEAAFAAALLSSASIPVRDVRELGSGGGHNAVHPVNRTEHRGPAATRVVRRPPTTRRGRIA